MLNILVQEKANPSQYSPTILGSMALCQGAKQPPWYILQNYLQILFWDLQFACLNTLDWLSVEKNTFSGASPFHIWTWGVPRSPEWDEKGRVCSHVQLPGRENFHFSNLVTLSFPHFQLQPKAEKGLPQICLFCDKLDNPHYHHNIIINRFPTIPK